jgi:anti-anti-sigma factor
MVPVLNSTDPSANRFEVGISFTGPDTVVLVAGEVDVATAPELGAILDGVINRHRQNVVLDLSQCVFLDASGLGIMVRAVNQLRLRFSEGTLTIRSSSLMVRRILRVTGVDQLVIVEAPAVNSGLGREQLMRTTKPNVAISADTALTQMRQITAIPAADDVVDSALRLVVALAKATVPHADGVSVSLSRHGQLTTVAASDRTILDMDADQYSTGQGPCVDASIEGRWFHAASLSDETRWPAFTPLAQTLGINAILSNPLVARDRSIGALNIYSRTAGAFRDEDQQLAAVFATEASAVLTHAGLEVTDEQLALGLTEALRSREVIAQAQGILMNRNRLDAAAGHAFLRNFSRSTNRPIRQLAEEMVTFTLGPELGGNEIIEMHVD